ncbi:MAG: thiazole synthase [Oleiphilaceae bacterium]|jgi:thiazole synthase
MICIKVEKTVKSIQVISWEINIRKKFFLRMFENANEWIIGNMFSESLIISISKTTNFLHNMRENKMQNKPWMIEKDIQLTSKLMVGTEQYDSAQMIRDVMVEANSELLIATINPEDRSSGVPLSDIVDLIGNHDTVPVITTSFAKSADEAITIACRLRESLGIKFLKLDIRNDEKQVYPNNKQTIEAANILLKEGFTVMPMILPDPHVAMTLQDMGCCAIRLMAGEIRGNKGIYNLYIMQEIKKMLNVPCVGEAGISTLADVVNLFSIGMDAVLVNTMIANAEDPILMAKAVRLAVESANCAKSASLNTL